MLIVLADAGSRDKPSVTDDCLDPETLSFCFKEAHLSQSVAVDLCATRGNTRCNQYVSPCADFDPKCVGWDVRVVDWSRFQQVYLFPPVSILIDLIPKIKAFPGRGLLIAPPPEGSALTLLNSSVFTSQPLPEEYFLFQMIDGEMVERRKYHDYWMWVF